MSQSAITPAMARRIDLWPVERLVPYARNARTHSPGQVAQIAASIVEFGFTNPILVDSNDGIVAGHGRLLAARKLGLGEVPVIVLDHLSQTQRRAYLLADNRLAMSAGWNDEALVAELAALESDGFDLGVIGFTEHEIADLLTDPEGASATEAEEEIPVPPARAVTGEEPVLAQTTKTMAEVAAERGVARDQVNNPRLQDSRRIQHHGLAPFYGSRKAS